MPIRNKWMLFQKPVIQKLPTHESGVYEVGKARGNVVLYIGKSRTSIRGRLLIEKGRTDFLECTHFRRRRTTYPEDADKLEKQLLMQYLIRYGELPPINKIMAPGDSWEGILY